MPDTTARLLIRCPDKPGIVAAASGFLYNHGANITSLDQYSTDPEGGTFFMRVEFQTPHLDLTRPVLEQTFRERVAEPYGMSWRMTYAADLKKMAIMASKYEHAILEILWRWARKELPADVVAVISNHPDLREAVESFGVAFHHIPVESGSKEEAETRALEILEGSADVVVLARYMQILSGDFVSRFPDAIINIHHSFLPAFAGADPYRQAYEKGVKRIGATAHYVTEGLDEGPIIEQDVVTVSHRYGPVELKRLGRDIERTVLARAVRWHLEDRIIVHENKTVVFA
jgi:formyltetrahydrofolate deformylase